MLSSALFKTVRASALRLPPAVTSLSKLLTPPSVPAVPTVAHYSSTDDEDQNENQTYSESEYSSREALAAAHWLTHHFRMDDLTWNHISARLTKANHNSTNWDNFPQDQQPSKEDNAGEYEGDADDFLVTPGNKIWKYIKPQVGDIAQIAIALLCALHQVDKIMSLVLGLRIR